METCVLCITSSKILKRLLWGIIGSFLFLFNGLYVTFEWGGGDINTSPDNTMTPGRDDRFKTSSF